MKTIMGSCTESGQRSCLFWLLSRTTSLGDVNTQVSNCNSCCPCEQKLFWSARDQSTGRQCCSMGWAMCKGEGAWSSTGKMPARALQRGCTDPQKETLEREEEKEWLSGAVTNAAAPAQPAVISLECLANILDRARATKWGRPRGSSSPLLSVPWQLPHCPALLCSIHESGHLGKSCPTSCALDRQAGITFLFMAWKSTLKDHALSYLVAAGRGSGHRNTKHI